MSDDRTDPQDPVEPTDPARRLLARARKARPVRRTLARPDPDEVVWSGPRADPRDPATLGDAVGALVAEQNWSRTLTEAGLMPRWGQIVGAEVAEHCKPEKLEAGELHLVAESTAWATQLRLLSRQLLARIAAEAGPDVVTRITVRGPTSPNWRHGPLKVDGRGPRDTYG